MSPLQPQRVRSAPEQIAANIKASVLDGTLAPGDKLPGEERLAEMYGVSRPTVREALRTLRADHVLESSRGRTGGYRVAELSLRALSASVAEVISLSLSTQTLSYAQLFEVRHALELQSAAAAAEHRTDEDLVRLREALPGPEALDESAEEVLARDLAFHRTLAESGHNPLIVGFAGATATAFRRFSDDVRGVEPTQVFAYLDTIADAVASGEPAAAREAMRAHLAYFAQYFHLP
jgi:GntR family transcriptional repressor for pyruvate dehydrogenase complex